MPLDTRRPAPPSSGDFSLCWQHSRSFALFPRPRSNPSGWLALPEGRHILLAACRSGEEAKEYYAEGKTWGVFSYFLRTALEKTSGVLTYQDAFKEARARVRAKRVAAVSPIGSDGLR